MLALRDKVKENGAAYAVATGPRVGRTTSKEQYAFVYDTSVLEFLLGQYTSDDDGDDSVNPGDLFEREPFVCSSRVKGAASDFVLTNIPTTPDDAPVEFGYLDDAMVDAEAYQGDPDVICLGDSTPTDPTTTRVFTNSSSPLINTSG
jgi:hypothetical protein